MARLALRLALRVTLLSLAAGGGAVSAQDPQPGATDWPSTNYTQGANRSDPDAPDGTRVNRNPRIAPAVGQRFDSLTDSLTDGRQWTWWTPLDSNSLNFNGKDAAGRMRTGVCTTGGQGVAGSNPVIPTNKYRVESTCSVQPFSVCSHFVARLWHGSGICQRTAAI